MKFCKYWLCLSLALIVGIVSSLSAESVLDGVSLKAFEKKSDVMLLRSDDFHNGNCDWSIIKHTEGVTAGEKLSHVGSLPQATAGSKPVETFNAIVPGTVLNTLVYNHVYPEPYYGMNNGRQEGIIPDLEDVGPEFYTYWFRTEFELPKKMKGKQIILEFDGINYRAELWVNGKEVGRMDGMFTRGFFDITDVVEVHATNALAVLVHPIDVPGGIRKKNKKSNAVGENKNGGDGKVGKNVTQLMSVGWDFTFSDGVRDRNTGIWKDVKIFAVKAVEVRNSYVKAELDMPEMKQSRQTVSTELTNHTDKEQSGTVIVTIPKAKVKVKQKVTLAAGETKMITFSPDEYSDLIIKNPEIWYPINKGDQPLYIANIAFKKGLFTTCDKERVRFGVRHVISDRNTPDKSRQFYINGKKIFLHGTNWIPEAMLRQTEKRTRAELVWTKQAGINFMRFWAGGTNETEYFFDLCDELGIMISMEYWLTGDTDLPTEPELYRANVADTIKFQRNHPCLIYHITANERGTHNVIKIEDLVAELDGQRGWQAASEIEGIHDGSPYKYVNPMFYYDDTASNRGSRINGLCPEYGTECLPTLDCLKEMMDEKDIWPVNTKVWNYHDGNGFHDMASKYVPAILKYGPVETADELAWKGQMVGAVSYRSVWEVWTYNRLDNGDRYTSGVWFWYHNNPIRQVCARMWDWSLEPTAALYYSMDAHEPIHGQFDFIKNTVSVNNEYYTPFVGEVRVRILNLDMAVVYDEAVAVTVDADDVANDVLKVELPDGLTPMHFIRIDITGSKGEAVADTFYWRSTEEYKGKGSYTGPLYGGFPTVEALPEVTVTSELEVLKSGQRKVTVTNPSDALAFMVHVELRNTATDKPVRPVYYSDNYFSLLPGESKCVIVEPLDEADSWGEIFVDGWNVEKSVVRLDK